MKNDEKIMMALKKAFPGHHVVSRCIEGNYSTESVFIDGKCVGLFYKDFFRKDFDKPEKEDYDNPEIEIKVKAPLKYFENFIKNTGCTSYMRLAVEEGVKKWEKESQQNS